MRRDGNRAPLPTPQAKIIVGTDFSDSARLALYEAICLARRVGADVVLAHCWTPPPEDQPAIHSSPHLAAITPDSTQSQATRTRLDELRTHHLGLGVRLSHTLIEKAPTTGILQLASETEAAMVVIGASTRKRRGRTALGPVAAQVARLAHETVLIARGTVGLPGYRRILLATDFSETAHRAIQTALQYATDDSKLTVLYALDASTVAAATAPPGFFAAAREAVSARGAEFVREHRARRCDQRTSDSERGAPFTMGRFALQKLLSRMRGKGVEYLVLEG